MAAGSITSLPALPEDGGGAFPPGHFKDPKRLYCKNGGFFLRIHPDGRVDGVREKSDPHGESPPPTRAHGLPHHTLPRPRGPWDTETGLPSAPRHHGPWDTGNSFIPVSSGIRFLLCTSSHNSRWAGSLVSGPSEAICWMPGCFRQARGPRLPGVGGRRVSTRLASRSHSRKQRQDETLSLNSDLVTRGTGPLLSELSHSPPTQQETSKPTCGFLSKARQTSFQCEMQIP